MSLPSPLLALLGEQLQLAVTATGLRGRRDALNESARLLRGLSELDRRLLAQDLLEAGVPALASQAVERTGPTASPGAVGDLARALLSLDRETLWWVGGALRDPATVTWLTQRAAAADAAAGVAGVAGLAGAVEAATSAGSTARVADVGGRGATGEVPAGAAVLRPTDRATATSATTAGSSGVATWSPSTSWSSGWSPTAYRPGGEQGASPGRAGTTTGAEPETAAPASPGAATPPRPAGEGLAVGQQQGSGEGQPAGTGAGVPRVGDGEARQSSASRPATVARPPDARVGAVTGRGTVLDRPSVGWARPGAATARTSGRAGERPDTAASPGSLAALISDVPAGWRRRAALRQALASGWEAEVDAVGVVEAFTSEADRFAAAARLVRAGLASAPVLAPLLPPAAARRLVRRSSVPSS